VLLKEGENEVKVLAHGVGGVKQVEGQKFTVDTRAPITKIKPPF
jgi:hypothetical protein